MTFDELLSLCLKVTGTFENGTPKYSGLTGNFDGQGMSAGILQWNAGQGTLQSLVKAIAEEIGWDRVQQYFKSDIRQFAATSGEEAITFCKIHYLEDKSSNLSYPAALAWRSLLLQPESKQVQNRFAEKEFLTPAINLSTEFCPTFLNRTRVTAFFFDVLVQEGSMLSVRPISAGEAAYNEALSFAEKNSEQNAALWKAACSDALTRLLIHYGYQRALLANPKYTYDAFSRRATIAARQGIVHGEKIDLTNLLD